MSHLEERHPWPKPGSSSDWLSPPDRRRLIVKSFKVGLGILAAHWLLYALTIALSVAPLALGWRIIAAIVNGILIGMLFVIGHDASHGIYLPGRRPNQLVARLVFLPSLHSASLWNIVHNRIHHSRTNLKGVDYVWAPMSKSEFDQAGRLGRLRERIYRSPFGPLIYYYGEFWPGRVLLLVAKEARSEWRFHLPDTLWVMAGLATKLAAIIWLGRMLAPTTPWWQAVLFGFIVPFAVFNYIMALTIYVQHTHPSVPWFDDEHAWSSYDGNIRGSTHVRLPFRVAPLWDMVLGHTAHHALAAIPIYHLPEAQTKLLERYSHDVVSYVLTPKTYLAITRACKLYDFDRMCWTDFEGVPTSPPARASARIAVYQPHQTDQALTGT
jgi:omega-6 fatty acid desaturase (delta-12 desaturase)